MAKFQHLVATIARFEELYQANVPVASMLPTLVKAYPQYQKMRIQDLCHKMHDFYRKHQLNVLLQQMFQREHLPAVSMDPHRAHDAYIRNQIELVPLSEIEGRIAVEGALPYPPGVLCIVPGEVWGGATLQYFRALEEGVNELPGFEPEIQGVYWERDANGRKYATAYVLKNNQI